MSKRIFLHIGFWLIYTLTYAILHTAFAAPSDLAYALPLRFGRMWVGELFMLPVKLTAAYVFIYRLVPRFLLKRKYGLMFLWTVLLIIPIVLLNRVSTYYIISPFLYGEIPSYELYTAKRFLYALLDVLPTVAIVATIKLLRSHLANQQREKALEKARLTAELNYLKAQTNPHFLFNTLNNIYALARKKSELTAPVVLQLSKILRYMLYECSQEKVSIAKEIQVIEDYLALEKLRYNDRLEVQFEQSIDYPSTQIAPLLLLPFIENAFKHGVDSTRFETWVKIYLEVKRAQLTFRIQNAKEGKVAENEKGIGLKNIQRQLTLTYPDRHQLIVNNEDKKYEIILHIDLD